MNPLSIVGAVSGGLGGLFGGISKNKMLRRQRQMLNDQQADNQNWYDRRYNEDATQRADAQAILSHTADMIRERNRQAAGAAAVGGGTEESVAATKAANAQALADATSQIAAAGAARKDQIEGQYRERKHAIDEALRGVDAQKKYDLDIASDTIGGAAGGIFDSLYLLNRMKGKDENAGG